MEQFNYKYIMNSYLYRMAPITTLLDPSDELVED